MKKILAACAGILIIIAMVNIATNSTPQTSGAQGVSGKAPIPSERNNDTPKGDAQAHLPRTPEPVAALPPSPQIQYDPAQQQKIEIFEQEAAGTKSCMARAAKAALLNGSRDQDKIIGFMMKICGNGLVTYMTQQMNRPAEEASQLIWGMALSELGRVPGVSFSDAPQ